MRSDVGRLIRGFSFELRGIRFIYIPGKQAYTYRFCSAIALADKKRALLTACVFVQQSQALLFAN